MHRIRMMTSDSRRTIYMLYKRFRMLLHLCDAIQIYQKTSHSKFNQQIE